MAPDQEERPHSPDLLEDESLNDIGVPPELPPGWAPAPLGTEGTPLRALMPGKPHLTSCPSVQTSPMTAWHTEDASGVQPTACNVLGLGST